MTTRGAGAIGAAAGYAMAQACLSAPDKDYHNYIVQALQEIKSTRPTARNLFFAVDEVYKAGKISRELAREKAIALAEADAQASLAIGMHGQQLIKENARILTHCNAGWLAFVDYGTALSPVYQAAANGKPVFVWVSETRPRNQGARLTAWELHNENIPHRIIADHASAWLMKEGKVDLVITGADRIALNGDTANKIGTLEKALAASYFGIPFYIAAPTSTFDPECSDGSGIIVEERHENELLFYQGENHQGELVTVRMASPGSSAYNPAFDITPASLITGFITEKGIIPAREQAIRQLLTKIG